MNQLSITIKPALSVSVKFRNSNDSSGKIIDPVKEEYNDFFCQLGVSIISGFRKVCWRQSNLCFGIHLLKELIKNLKIKC